jgi:hypothetical protein
MPEIAADPPSTSCCRLFLGLGFQRSQQLGPDPSSPCARRAASAILSLSYLSDRKRTVLV